MTEEEKNTYMRVLLVATNKMVQNAQLADHLQLYVGEYGIDEKSSAMLSELCKKTFLESANSLISIYHVLDSLVEDPEDSLKARISRGIT